ncbi:unnamed protein product [Caenorhabditis bovis]|uniref:G-protein coupled receptors family 1 profile domain-containing protein n=1 Tax=Caenorhabditis bovis TaxID=2654633 RepID=A0A8S1F9D5_9PELO|nr:unnamed protein product [Caenorhabditis bovis]
MDDANENTEGNITNFRMLTFPPPTQEPSDGELIFAVAHLALLTITLCGNVSQLVLMLYSNRFRRRSPIQFFIASLLMANALVGATSPWIAIELLIRRWMFSRGACRTFAATMQIGHTILPYLIGAIYVLTVSRTRQASSFFFVFSFQTTSTCPSHRCRFRQPTIVIAFLIIILALTFFIVAPVAASAKVRRVIVNRLRTTFRVAPPSINSIESLQLESRVRSKTLQSNDFSVRFETTYCTIPFLTDYYSAAVAALIEYIVPLTICVIFIMKLRIESYRQFSLFKIELYLCIITLLHFSTSWLHYLPNDIQTVIFFFLPSRIMPSDVTSLFALVASSLSWLPAACLSTQWHNHEVGYDLKSPQKLMDGMAATPLQPHTVRSIEIQEVPACCCP